MTRPSLLPELYLYAKGHYYWNDTVMDLKRLFDACGEDSSLANIMDTLATVAFHDMVSADDAIVEWKSAMKFAVEGAGEIANEASQSMSYRDFMNNDFRQTEPEIDLKASMYLMILHVFLSILARKQFDEGYELPKPTILEELEYAKHYKFPKRDRIQERPQE